MLNRNNCVLIKKFKLSSTVSPTLRYFSSSSLSLNTNALRSTCSNFYNYPPSCFFTTSTNNDKDPYQNESIIKDLKTDKSNQENPVKIDKGIEESLEFKAETKQLLDIVTNAIYTNKEVFLRELVSNASDALEKLRHMQVSNYKGYDGRSELADPDVPLEIRLYTDEKNKTLTISDTGIGLTREDMIKNLGTIAKSGSKEFIKNISKVSGQSTNSQVEENKGIIGKFGVGFYSSFMVADKVIVKSKFAYQQDNNNRLHSWSSTGVGSYNIAELSKNVNHYRGASIILYLKDNQAEYADEKRVEAVLKTYSNFVNFPIYLNGNRVNTMGAIWAEDPTTITDETYDEFYKYLANAYDKPITQIHYRADAPVEIKALFYLPSYHSEKYGMGRMDPGVSLYSRKILIESKSHGILPDWLRFMKGVVDSEDFPLSISREKPQDTALVTKLRKALTRKIINHFTFIARKEPKKYLGQIYKEYSSFFKEGVCRDFDFKGPLSKILYYDTSKMSDGKMSSLDEYVSRCRPEQKEIYYLSAPTRSLAMHSPYLESFNRVGVEVIFLYSDIDDFVMTNLGKFEKKNLTSVEKSKIDLSIFSSNDQKNNINNNETLLTEDEATKFCSWFQKILQDKVESCKVTDRLSSYPAIVTDTESAAMRKMMRYVNGNDGSGVDKLPLPKQNVEINPNNPIIAGLNVIRSTKPSLAKTCADQIFDNCLLAAGLVDDSQSMLRRINDILLALVTHSVSDSEDSVNSANPIEAEFVNTSTSSTNK